MSAKGYSSSLDHVHSSLIRDVLSSVLTNPFDVAKRDQQLKQLKDRLIDELVAARSVGEVRRIRSELETVVGEIIKAEKTDDLMAVILNRDVQHPTSSISADEFTHYLSELVRAGLVSKSDGPDGQTYSITKEGMNFLDDWSYKRRTKTSRENRSDD
jgi:predicted transcriptional regulator